MRKVGLMLMWLCVAGAAWAQGPKAVRAQVEASMLVTAMVDIEPDGRVSGYALDQAEALPDYAIQLLASRIPAWRFEPVVIDGVAVAAKAPASIRLVARRSGDDAYSVRIAGVSFQPRNRDGRSSDLRPPAYPPALARAGVGGTVYLIVKVRTDGQVEDAFAEQVNLQAISGEPMMTRMRRTLARVSISAARGWAIERPDDVQQEGGYWFVRIPVEFIAPHGRMPGYGEWQAYIPGPLQENPWAQADGLAPDTLMAGGMYPLQRKGPRLLTPLEVPNG